MLQRLFLLLALVFGPCLHAQVGLRRTAGFSDLDSLARAFVRSLKASPEATREFSKQISLNEATVALLEKKYGWTPTVIRGARRVSTTDAVGVSAAYYDGFTQDFRSDLQRFRYLDSLQYVSREHKEHQLKMGGDTIPWTEEFFYFKSRTAGFRCSFGELYKVNGCWRTFSDPKFNTFPRAYPPGADTAKW